MSSTATALLAWLREERRFWNEQAHEDEVNTFVRHGAISRRDQLDTVLLRLEKALPAIEAEAAERDRNENDRLFDILESGYPV